MRDLVSVCVGGGALALGCYEPYVDRALCLLITMPRIGYIIMSRW